MDASNLWNLRQEGISNAALAQDARAPHWSERADDFLRRFAVSGREFIGEDLIEAARREGFVADNEKAWGAAIIRAKKAGVIVHTGKFSTQTTNRCPKKIWRKA